MLKDNQRKQTRADADSLSGEDISVVVFCYNFDRYIAECLDSLISQTCRPGEIIVSDDCSTDGSWDIIAAYQKRHPELIRAYRQPQNIGMPENSNFALRQARGRLITWMDGDDRLLPAKLETELAHLVGHPDVQLAYSNVRTIDPRGDVTGVWHDGKAPYPPSGNTFIPVFSKTLFPNRSTLFRNPLVYRSVLERSGLVDTRLNILIDYDLKIRLSHSCRFIYTNEILNEYRLHAGGIHNTAMALRRSDLIRIFKKNAGLLADLALPQQTALLENVATLYQRYDPHCNPFRIITPLAAEAGLGLAAEQAQRQFATTHPGCDGKTAGSAVPIRTTPSNTAAPHEDTSSMKIKPLSKVANKPAQAPRRSAPQPRISVFITSYNQKTLLAEAIESVLNQTLAPWEIIVVDDASEDGSQALIRQYAEQYPKLIKPIFHATNMGVTQSRIDALNRVSGAYVTYVDGDDRFLPAKLEKEYAALCRTPRARIAFSNNYYMNAAGERFGVWIEDEKPPEGNVFVQTFGRIYPKRSLYRMELVDYDAWRNIGFHDLSLSIYEDFDMRIRMTKELQTVYCDEPLSEIRYHGTGLSSLRGRIHQKSLDYIFEKNKDLLADLKPLDRKIAEKGFQYWRDNATTKAIREISARNESPSGPAATSAASSPPPASRPVQAPSPDYRGHDLIFLISQPRAGSTLLQRMIAGHPEIHTTAEPWIMLHPLYALKRTGIETEYRAALACDGREDFLSQFSDGDLIHIESLRLQAAHLYGQALRQTGKRFFLDKTPRYYHIIPELYRVFPEAKFVFLIRNPLSVFSSTLKTWLNNDRHRIDPATRLDLYEAPQCLMDGARLLKESAFVVHYEQLVGNPRREIKRLCAHLDLSYSDDLLEYGARPAPAGRFGDPHNIHKHLQPVAVYVDKWKDNLNTAELIEAAEELLTHIGDATLAQMGYPLSDLREQLQALSKGSSCQHAVSDGARDCIRQGEALMAAQKPEEALAAFTAAIRMQPGNAEAHNNLGVVYCRLNQIDKALESYQRAVSLDPASICFQKNLADLLCIATDRIAEAAAIYTNIIADNPQDTDALLGMAQVCLSNGRFKDALEFCATLQAFDPQNSQVGPLIDRIHRTANQNRPAETDPPLRDRIEQHVQQGRLADAAQDLEEFIRQEPGSAVAYNDLGVLYSQLGETAKIEGCFRRAVALDPQNPTFQKNLADYLYGVAGRHAAALSIYQTLAVACPQDVEVWLACGQISAAQNFREEAFAAFQKVLALEPHNEIANRFMTQWTPAHEALETPPTDAPAADSASGPSATSWQLDDRIPVLIYQMGKVGSTTVRDSLDSHGIYNQHTHLLSWEGIERAENRYRGIGDGRIPDRIQRYRALREFIERAPRETRWQVVTLVREPIARLISSVFQNLNVHFPGVERFDDDLLPRLEQQILEQLARFDDDANGEYKWFDNELKKVFGFDIFQSPFDARRGYQVYQADNLDVLALQLERLSDCAGEAFCTFFDLPSFTLTHANVSRKKAYHAIYRKLLASIAIPDEILERVYTSRLVRHFYSPAQIEDFAARWRRNGHRDRMGWTEPRMRVSAIVSTYNSERFIKERLENLIDQTLYQKGQLEIIVVDSHSKENEGAVVSALRQDHPDIKYVRTPVREGVYAAWNRGIKSSTGTYFVNANTDDRFAPDALEVLADALDANPDYDAAYGDWLITKVENDRFESATPKSQLTYPAYHPPLLFYLHIASHANFVRRRVFDQIGLFDGSLNVFGDREFMFRFACAGLKALKIDQCVGLYLENPSSLARRTTDAQKNEWWPLVEHYTQTLNFLRLMGCDHLPEARTIGAFYAEAGCLGKDLWSIDGERVSSIGPSPHLFAKAIEHDPTNVAAINNLAVLRCSQTEAGQFFATALNLAAETQKRPIEENLALHRAGVVDFGRYHFMMPAPSAPRVYQNKQVPCGRQETAPPPPSVSGASHRAASRPMPEHLRPVPGAIDERPHEKKLAQYMRRLKQQPDDVETLLSIGALCTKLGRVEDALDFYLNALAADLHCREAGQQVRGLLARLEAAATEPSPDAPSRRGKPTRQSSPKVSAIVSVYNAERYLEGCLQDLVNQTIADRLEIIVVDSGSTQNEAAIVRAFQARHDNIRYIRTEKRESVYAAWNRGIRIAKGDYITNANADDRHRADALAIMSDTLDRHPDIALVYADCIITETENQTFSDCTPVGSFRWRAWNRNDLLGGDCFIGPQPMWRRSLHKEYGYFDESYVTSGDYEYWCRIAPSSDFLHVKQLLGLYLRSPRSLEHRNEDLKATENQTIMARHGRNADSSKTTAPIAAATPVEIQLSAGQVPTILNQVRQSYEEEDYATAVQYLHAVMAVYPDCWDAYLLMAQTMLQSTVAVYAVEQLWRALENRRDVPSSVIAAIGHLYEAADDPARAKQLLEMARGRDAACPWTLNLEGILAYRRGDAAAAAQSFQKAAAADAEWGEPWTNMGVMAWESGDAAKALDCFEKGFDLSPTAPHIATSYHRAVEAAGQYKRSLIHWEKATHTHPAFCKGWYFLIDALVHLQDYRSAMPAVEAVIRRFGSTPEMLTAATAIRQQIGPLEISNREDSVSLCMIVKDEAEHIGRCLSSLKPVVDEIVVVDTGSSDATKALAAVFGAKVFDYAWTDDFAAARNYSLSQARGRWILVMDADEIISPTDYKRLKTLLKRHRSGDVAFSVTTRNYTHLCNLIGWVANDQSYGEEEAGTGWTPSTKVRIFPNRPSIRFEYPVHEVVRPSLERERVRILDCPVPVHHYGYLNQNRASAKGEAYYQIGIKKLHEMRHDPTAIRELAIQAELLGHHREAVDLWHRLLELEPQNARGYVNLATAFGRLGRYQKARGAALQAVALDSRLKEAHFNAALAELHLGRAQEAARRLKPLVLKYRKYYPALFILGCARICCDERREGQEILSRLKSTPLWRTIGLSIEEIAQGLTKAGRTNDAQKIRSAADELQVAGAGDAPSNRPPAASYVSEG